MHKAFIGIGSNLGDKRAYCERALACLDALPKTQLKRVSSFYLTEPTGEKQQPWFFNLVAMIETDLAYQELFFWLKLIETRLGRFPTWDQGPRIIDLDLLLFDDVVVNTPTLTIPHPRLHQRGFVLVPLVEVAREEKHPILKQSFKNLLSQTKFKEWVIRVR
ncbi:MAG: 2-amino-4-hydroxy-6-hydroxymethyldihydropteridine diphosphokinase [Candidatus Desulfofervidaceae bacterium]|nr:2-amino-4-hydroxy-6-hydroxymethyldihydropteridine diphosphokinase [Candidatus Desulfofervidaceae bacterium]MDL1971186.1 2-amino-4-hydroxy-6-hydroxymethyldihydropteridine diphosphokinase [Candidatus Desulfofervidaceae bacterium]